MKKIHLIDTVEKAENWTQSPHIVRAIKMREFTKCGQIMSRKRLTDDPTIATCVACLGKTKAEESK